MKKDVKQILESIAKTIRELSIEAVERANSGHPGLPLGCAEIAAYLYGVALKHNPKNPNWLNRDRFVLSAGHGSMLLYSVLHLAGFDVPLDEIKNFRQLNSKTPGHPEVGMTPGVEATTGPLGQGIGNAVGNALAYKILAARFNKDGFQIFNNKIFCLASDGDLMEGVSHETSSLAGHLQLNNLILIYDYNAITLDGKLSDSCSENTKMRYKAYGWDVLEVDGHDLEAIDKIVVQLKKTQKSPTLIIANTIIGKGSPGRAGSNKAHGQPLGKEEFLATKRALGLPDEEFYIPKEVTEFFAKKLQEQSELESNWNALLDRWKKSFPELQIEFEKMQKKEIPENLEEELNRLYFNNPISGRGASSIVLQLLSQKLPFLIGGSADLSSSDMTLLNDFSIISKDNFNGRNMKFGVREFGMGTITNGIALSGMFLPFCGTFLVFSDYMRPSIRLAALSSLKVIYQFTHDSIFLGEDGPTHQPIEQLASFRAMPNLQVIRPADCNEVKMAWIAALNYDAPTALIFSRQNLPELSVTKKSYKEGVGRGAYIVKIGNIPIDFTLFATGSELQLALGAAEELEKRGKSVRVISMPSFAIFDRQDEEYRKSILEGELGKRVAIEAASSFGWHRYIGRDGIVICQNDFGTSAPAKDINKEFGFTVEAIVNKLLR